MNLWSLEDYYFTFYSMHGFHYSVPDRSILSDWLRFFNWCETLFYVAFWETKGTEAETNVSRPIYISKKGSDEEQTTTVFVPKVFREYLSNLWDFPHCLCLLGWGNLQRRHGTARRAVVMGMGRKGRVADTEEMTIHTLNHHAVHFNSLLLYFLVISQ